MARINCFDLDYFRIKKALCEKFGGDWIIFTKFHPRNLDKVKYLLNNETIDVSNYSDIQELLNSEYHDMRVIALTILTDLYNQ